MWFSKQTNKSLWTNIKYNQKTAASSFKNIPEHLIPSHIQVSIRPIRNAICWFFVFLHGINLN